MSILAKTFEQLMLWQGKMTESSSDSTLITVMESMVDPSIFPLLIASSILLAIHTTSCQYFNVAVVG